MAGESLERTGSRSCAVAAPGTHLGPRLSAEAEVERFGRYIVENRLASDRHAPYWLLWVRRFLHQPAHGHSTKDATQEFLRGMVRDGQPDWRVAQAERSVGCFCGAWREAPSGVSSARLEFAEDGTVADVEARAALRALARLRHYSTRTEGAYADWMLRFFQYLDQRDGQGRRTRHAVTGAGVRPSSRTSRLTACWRSSSMAGDSA